MAQRAEGDEVLPGHGGHGAGDAVIHLDLHTIGESPYLLAVGQRQAADRLLSLRAVVVVDVDAARQDGGGGVALGHGEGPELRRPALGPLPAERHVIGADVVEPRAAKARPGARQVRGLRLAADERARQLDRLLGRLPGRRRAVRPGHPLDELARRACREPQRERRHAGERRRNGHQLAHEELHRVPQQPMADARYWILDTRCSILASGSIRPSVEHRASSIEYPPISSILLIPQCG